MECLIASIYLPNGNPQPGPKFNYKLAWFERLIAHAASELSNGRCARRIGRRLQRRANGAKTSIETRSLDNNALVQPQSRQRVRSDCC